MEDLHEIAARRLGSTGNRYTRGRRRLVHELYTAGRPLTVRELLDRAETLSTSSVYRNLAILEACRVVRQIPSLSDDGVRVELHEDLTGHHHHLGCSSCGDLVDVILPEELESALAMASAEVETVTGFRAEGHRLELFGTCRSCQ